MTTIPISDFRNHLAHYLKRAQQGEALSVTSHGEVLAIISPPDQPRLEAKAALKVIAEQAAVYDIVSPLDEPWDALK